MYGRIALPLREECASRFVEAAKLQPEKFAQKIQDANLAIDRYRPLCNAQDREKLLDDVLYCDACFGASAEQYFSLDFEHLSNEKRDTFVTDRVRFQFYQSVNTLDGVKILNDKYLTYQRFRKYYHREVFLIRSVSDAPAFFEFVSRHPKFIMKPINLYGGLGIRIVDIQQENVADVLSSFLSHKGGFVIEEIITQSAIMNSVNSSCLNTVRIMTAHFASGTEIFYSYARFGRSGTVVDNFTSGGLIASVDVMTGQLSTFLADHFRNFYDKHPESGITAKGFQLPEWGAACAMVKELAALIPENRVVGWDLAHTENGWVMIEGNGCPQTVQVFSDEGLLPIFESVQQRLLQELGAPCSWEN